MKNVRITTKTQDGSVEAIHEMSYTPSGNMPKALIRDISAHIVAGHKVIVEEVEAQRLPIAFRLP